MRASYHNGRGSARHNDRDFDLTKAKHIDPERTGQNVKVNIAGSALRLSKASFDEAERLYYEHLFGRTVEAQNTRAIEQRHPERVKTVSDYRMKHPPEETILQVGAVSDGVTPDQLSRATMAFLDKISRWNRAHGGHMHVLSIAWHFDESTPHAHMRRVWVADGKDGLPVASMNRALEQAGVSLPNPDKPEGRYNNRKQAFDSMCREMWHEAIREQLPEVDLQTAPQKAVERPLRDYKALREAGTAESITGLLRASEELTAGYLSAMLRGDVREMVRHAEMADAAREAIAPLLEKDQAEQVQDLFRGTEVDLDR